MSLILTSDFPATIVPVVVDRLKSVAPDPRVAWIPPSTDDAREQFALAQQQFAAIGVPNVEHCDIDQEVDEVQLAYLSEYDVIFLTSGDPIRFRYNLRRTGAAGKIGHCLRVGRLVVAAGGGALQLTPNVSVFRLQSEPLDTVLSTRAAFNALGAVPYEIIPRVNRCEAEFLDKVLEYSAHIDDEIIAIEDGGALVHDAPGHFEATGQVMRFHKGVRG